MSTVIRSLLFILLGTIFSYIVMIFILPDVFWHHRFSFIRFGDSEHNYYGVFTLLSNFYHGGIQLWNPFDQMPLTYYYLTGGLTSFANIITAVVYILISPFFRSQAYAYQEIYSVIYFLPTIGVVVIGTYLLCRRFLHDQLLLFLLTVVAATIYIPHFYLGLGSASMFGFFPLLLHFTLLFFERFRLKDVLLSLLTLGVCFSMDLELAVGYFYQGFHFFVLAAIGWVLIKKKNKLLKQIKEFWQNKEMVKQVQYDKRNIRSKLRKIVIVGILCTILLSPWAYLFKESYHDYTFGYGPNRFADYNPFDFSAYFTREHQHAPFEELPIRILDFTNNKWDNNWLFLGFTIVFFSLYGFFMSPDGRKYIFAGTIIFFWSLNTPRVMTGWFSWIHWLNSITNPLNPAVRSMHMTGAFLLSFILVPIAAMGMEAIRNNIQTKSYNRLRIGFFAGAVILYARYLTPAVSMTVLNRLFVSIGITSLLFLIIKRNLMKKNIQNVSIAILFILLFTIDGVSMRHYIELVSKQIPVIPHKISSQGEKYLLDFQNPKVFPLRRFFTADTIAPVPYFLYVNPNNMQGLFYRYTNMNKFFEEPSIYHPRHVSFSPLFTKKEVRKYVESDSRIITFADSADNVIFAKDDTPIKTVTLSFSQTKTHVKDNLHYYQFELPQDFPSYLTTGVFTNDVSLLKAEQGDIEFTPVQGGFSKEYQFDVQNYSTGKLTVTVPTDNKPDDRVVLTYPQTFDGFTIIKDLQPDQYLFDYNAPSDGYLVLRFPFDTKWNVTVDKKSVTPTRVYESFLGIDLTKGTHSIHLSYWPNPLIRPLIGLVIVLIVVIPFGIMWQGIKEEGNGRS